MPSSWHPDLEKGPKKSEAVITPPNGDSDSKADFSHCEIQAPLSSSSKNEYLNLPYGDRLVYNYLAPRPHPHFDNMNYDSTIIQATRFRDLNINRIQHDLLCLQHTLTQPGGGTAENFARLSSLLHEHTTAIRDKEFIFGSTIKIHHNPRYMDKVCSQYPEIPWEKGTALHRLALLRGVEERPQNIYEILCSIIPRAWCWSKKERELRHEAYKLDLQGRPGLRPKYPSVTATILAGIIVSLTSSMWILIPTIIMSFQASRTKCLITVGIAVTLFGFFLVVGVRTKSSETFLATATYAAILVVFIGSSSSTNN